jgi:hypothetical protein
MHISPSLYRLLIEEIQTLHALSTRGTLEKFVLSDEDIQTIAKAMGRINGYLADFQVCSTYSLHTEI